MIGFLRRRRESLELSRIARKSNGLDELRGCVAGSWAGIESCIDQANYYAWHITKGTFISKIPINFRWKVETFKKLHVELPLFQPLECDATALLARLSSHINDRHFLIHGYYIPDAQGGLLLAKHVFDKDGGITTTKRRFMENEIQTLPADLLDIQKQATRYLNALIAEIDKNEGNQVGG